MKTLIIIAGIVAGLFVARWLLLRYARSIPVCTCYDSDNCTCGGAWGGVDLESSADAMPNRWGK